MSAKKQTAVMFFIESMTKEHPDFMVFIYSNPEIYNKALQMEREQIDNAIIFGHDESTNGVYLSRIDFNQYYTDTYGE